MKTNSPWRPQAIIAFLVLIALGSCDRAIEPFDPEEKVEAPDLSRIFPSGAERAGKTESLDFPDLPTSAVGSQTIRGNIGLAPNVGRNLQSGTLFIIARFAAVGPPTAVVRVAKPNFPLDFEIGPDDRMLEGVPFTGPFHLSAKLDSDGNALTRDDVSLVGKATDLIAPGDRDVVIVLRSALEK